MKNTPVVRKVGKDRKSKKKKPSTWQNLNPRPPNNKACALPLCYNHYYIA